VGGGDQFLADLLSKAPVPVVLALNKIDLVPKNSLLPRMEQWSRLAPFKELVPVSALTGENEAVLEAALLRYLPDGEPLYPQDYLTDQPERAFVAEIVREKVLRHTRDELPFSSAVLVDRFEETDERGLMRLYCTIVVERESQKPIVIGRGGTMIKQIGTEARQELEAFFNARVFLDLRVKTRANWREDPRLLDEIGIREE
jgi:GTPase